MIQKVVLPSFREDEYSPYDMRQLVSALELRFQSLESNQNSIYVSDELYSPVGHTHSSSEVLDLDTSGGGGGGLTTVTAGDIDSQSAIDGWVLTADGSGGVAWEAVPASGGIGAEVNDLTAAVTWVNVPDANITESSVTQHEAALSIVAGNIDSEASTDGWVLTSDGASGATWKVTNTVAIGNRVTAAESDIADNVTDIGDLQTQINTLAESVAAEVYIQPGEPVPGVAGVPDPIADAARWYDSDDNNHPYIYDQGTTTWVDLEDPRIGANESDITALDVRMDTAEGNIVTNASAVSSLDTTVSTLSGTVSANAANITQLESDLTTTDGNVSANASGLSGLTTRVTTAEGDIIASANDIIALDSSVTTAQGDITANASAVSGLTTRVTTAENDISVQAGYVTTLQSEMTTAQGDIDTAEITIGAQTTAISTAEGNITALEAKYGVSLNVNGYITGFAQNNDGTTGEFVILADKFAIVDPSGDPGETEYVPFSVVGGVVTMLDVVVNGIFDAGIIKQSYFTPADANTSFRIACDYPANYSGGSYTGKAAHLSPVLTTGYSAPAGSNGSYIISTSAAANTQAKSRAALLTDRYNTAYLRVYSPTYSGTEQYGRLGTLSENLAVRYSACLQNELSGQRFWAVLKYRYDGGTEHNAYIRHAKACSTGTTAAIVAEDVFITKDTAWNYLDIRLGLGGELYDSTSRATVQSVNLTLTTANFGYADLAGITEVVGGTTGATTDVWEPTNPYKQYTDVP